MLQMGHCAPSIMQTLLEINCIYNTELVIYAGALAGGIAGPDMECGGITAPLMFMSYKNHGLILLEDKLNLIAKAQKYTEEFKHNNGSCNCSEISNKGMLACMKVICNVHKPLSKALSAPTELDKEAKSSYSLLLKAFDDSNFHCSQSVLRYLKNDIKITNELFDSAWVFIGGTGFLNQTCGALTAGVMAISAARAKVENSYSKVAKMIWLLMHDDKRAMNNDINDFNQSIRMSDELGCWFRDEFGSTSCYDICGFNFSKVSDSNSYLSNNSIEYCKLISKKVAQKVIIMI